MARHDVGQQIVLQRSMGKDTAKTEAANTPCKGIPFSGCEVGGNGFFNNTWMGREMQESGARWVGGMQPRVGLVEHVGHTYDHRDAPNGNAESREMGPRFRHALDTSCAVSQDGL